MVRAWVVAAACVLGIAMGSAIGVRAAQQQPQTTVPPTSPSQPAQPGGPAPLQTRTFAAPAGLLFTAVRPERVADFEKVMAYLHAALEKSTDPTIREQAKGWRVFKATENGPGNTVLYVYVLDPTVASAEYGLGRILVEGFPDQAEQLWKLYTGAVSGGGTLLNLTPVKPVPPPPLDPAGTKKP